MPQISLPAEIQHGQERAACWVKTFDLALLPALTFITGSNFTFLIEIATD